MAFEQTPITAPFKGIDDSLPAPYKDPRAWDDLLNMFVYRGRLITRPRLNAYSSSPDGSIIWNMIPFLDILGNLHNLILTASDAYMLTPGPTWNGPLLTPAWDSTVTYAANDIVLYSGTVYVARTAGVNLQPDTHATNWAPIDGSIVNSALPWGYELVNGRVYFSNGSLPGLYSDGEATLKSMRHPGSFRFAALLGNHLVTAYTTEPAPQVPGSTVFPFRVRWSDTGHATVWTEGASTSAGHIDLLDVPDAISGFVTLGRTGFVFRTNGITMMTPTGVGTNPFQFDQVTHAPKGVGNYYPFSMDAYGSIAAFCSEEDIYLFDGSTFTAIGGPSKNKIYADIGTTTADKVLGQIIGRFNPKFKYLSYWISLPSSVDGFPVAWVYSWDNQTWQRFRSSSLRLTEIANLVA